MASQVLLTHHGPSLHPDLLHRTFGALNGTPFQGLGVCGIGTCGLVISVEAELRHEVRHLIRRFIWGMLRGIPG